MKRDDERIGERNGNERIEKKRRIEMKDVRRRISEEIRRTMTVPIKTWRISNGLDLCWKEYTPEKPSPKEAGGMKEKP